MGNLSRHQDVVVTTTTKLTSLKSIRKNIFSEKPVKREGNNEYGILKKGWTRSLRFNGHGCSYRSWEERVGRVTGSGK